MKTILKILVFIPFTLCAQWTQLGSDLVGDNPGDRYGGAVSLSQDGTRIAIGAFYNSNGGTESGLVRVFDFDNDTWIQVGNDIVGQTTEEWLGSDVALSSDGSILAVGQPEAFDDGKVTVYNEIGGTWTQLGNTIEAAQPTIGFGQRLAMNDLGNVVIISAPSDICGSVNSGLVQVYGFDGSSWNQIGQTFCGQAIAAFMGQALAINAAGDRIAMASPMLEVGSLPNAGRVYVYELQGNSWVQLGQFLDGSTALQEFGRDLSFNASGDLLAVGSAYFTFNEGSAQVFELVGNSWEPYGPELFGTGEDDYFGARVEISDSGDVLAISAPTSDLYGDLLGYVSVFEYVNDTWIKIGEDIQGEQLFETTGVDLSLSGDGTVMALGSFRYGVTPGDETGRVRAFTYNDIIGTEDRITNTVMVYPNPASDLINLKTTSTGELVNISIYDVFGKMILDKQSMDSNDISIDIRRLSSGLYTMVVSGDSFTEKQKFVKK